VASSTFKENAEAELSKEFALAPFGATSWLSESMLKLVENPARLGQVANPVFSGVGFLG